MVEKSGTKVKAHQQRNSVASSNKCDDIECFICNNEEGGGKCRSSGVTYRIDCKNEICEYSYNGQTGKNGYSRGEEHKTDYEKKSKKSVMWNHCLRQHNATEQEFTMGINDYVRNDPTKRQILEGIRINKCPPERRMNDRTEWNQELAQKHRHNTLHLINYTRLKNK